MLPNAGCVAARAGPETPNGPPMRVDPFAMRRPDGDRAGGYFLVMYEFEATLSLPAPSKALTV